ncbi:MAG: helix-turn-helix domain-containing protein [Marinicellaceae bacterium]
MLTLSIIADSQLSKALVAIHADLAKPWTVQSLADKSAMSRSAFSNKFSALIGNTPIQYLTQIRLQCAYNHLQSTNDSIITVALNHGYQSEAAFSKVFKKHYGTSPGKISKKRQRTH